MTLSQYLGTLLRAWWVLLVPGLLGAGLAAGYVAVVGPTYSATAGVFVATSVSPKNAEDLSAAGLYAQQRIKTYVALGTSSVVLDRVRSDVGLREPVRTLARRITVQNPDDTAALDITVTAADPAQAAAIANSVARRLPSAITALEDPTGAGKTLLAPATSQLAGVPDRPIAPQAPATILLGALLGLCLGLVLAAVRHGRTQTVGDGDDVRQISGEPPIGGIPRDRAAGGHVGAATGDEAWVAAFARLRSALRVAGLRTPGAVLCVASAGEGDGRTTVAANLAYSLASAGLRVAVVDADLTGPDLRQRLGLEEGPGLSDVLSGRIELRDALREYAVLDVLTAGHYADDAAELAGGDGMAGVLSRLADGYDVVVIDGQVVLGNGVGTALAGMADGVLVVAARGRTLRRSLASALGDLRLVQAPVLGVVLNRTRESRPGPTGRRYPVRDHAALAPGAPDRTAEGAL